ncbi:MAG: hypothetical protein H6737_28480 [Alphaproteobacteria bacterium]|nr:hypothetical protein [Alphaproteobacteria bacterium]
MSDATTWWRDILEPVIRGRRFLHALDILVQATGASKFLHELGAERSFAVGARRGTGKLPDPAICEGIDLGLPGAGDMMAGIRSGEAALRDLPPDIRARIDAWDPTGEALAISTIFGRGDAIAGRRQLGGRPPAWADLEDKTVIDAVWDDAGVPRAPYRIRPAADFDGALAEVAGPRGAVVSGDSRDGFNGGGSHVRWIRSEADLPEAHAFFRERCDLVRVMPFLDGIPCSIHGIVFPDRTVGFRPVEMLVLRRQGQSTVQYCGAASYWNAPEADGLAMRALAERVGEHLRERVGFRGAFTVDGVLTADGFLPTELNPRLGAALPRLFHAIDTHLPILNRCIVEGFDLDWRPEALQAEVLRTTETSRSGHGMLQVGRPLPEEEVHVRFTSEGCEPCEADVAEGRMVTGPGPVGSLVFMTPDPAKTPIGPSLAPRIAAMAACADRLWSLGVGVLEPAPELR